MRHAVLTFVLLGAATLCQAQAPKILVFTATPMQIFPGDISTLTWVTENTSMLSISGIGTVSGTSVKVAPITTTTYTLTASNSFGSVSASATVTVIGSPPGSFTLDTTQLLYFDVPVADTRELNVTITPTAPIDITAKIQPASGTPSNAFVIGAANTSFTISQPRVVTISFSPAQVGSYAATLIVQSTSGTKTVDLRGGGASGSGIAITAVASSADHGTAAGPDQWIEVYGLTSPLPHDPGKPRTL